MRYVILSIHYHLAVKYLDSEEMHCTNKDKKAEGQQYGKIQSKLKMYIDFLIRSRVL